MSLFLNSSHQTEILLNILIQKLKGSSHHPLDPPNIVVPNQNLAKWVKLKITEKFGVSANLPCKLLSDYLWQIGLKWNPKVSTNSISRLTESKLQILLLEVIDNIKDSKNFEKQSTSFIKYWQGDVSHSKKISFAKIFSRLLLRYEQDRPTLNTLKGLVEHWPEKLFFSETDSFLRETENWQRELYRLIFSEGNVLDQLNKIENKRYITLPQLYQDLEEFSIPKNGTLQPIYLFCLAEVSPFERKSLLSVSKLIDIHIYFLNPCLTYWEDLSNPNRKRIIGKNISSKDENPILVNWGILAKENFKHWTEAAGIGEGGEDRFKCFKNYAEEYNNEDAVYENTSLLKSLQNSIVTQSNDLSRLDSNTIHEDSSLVVRNAPSIVREVEAVRNSILFLLKKNPELNLNDINIKIPNLKEYLFAINEVFENPISLESDSLNFSVNQNEGVKSQFANGITKFLNLRNENFSRKSILDLLRNPLIRNALDLSHSDWNQWNRWCEELNLFVHKSSSISDKNDEEIHNWIHGIKRMVLSQITNENVLLPNSESIFYPPINEMDSENKDSIEKFIYTIESLINEINHLYAKKWNWIDLCNHLIILSNYWFKIPQDDADENYSKGKFISQIEELKIRDGFGPVRNVEQAVHLFLSFLDFPIPPKGNFLTKGLVITDLKSCSSIPFEVTFILGLSDINFPGQEDNPFWDLRLAHRKPGDSSSQISNLHHLLESLMSTRQHLYLSYVSKNLKKDQDILPSRIILELETFVNSSKEFNLNPQTIPILDSEKAAETNEEIYSPTEQDVFHNVLRSNLIQFNPISSNEIEKEINTLWMDVTESKNSINKKIFPLYHDLKFQPQPKDDLVIDIDEILDFLINPFTYELKRKLNLPVSEDLDTSLKDNIPISFDNLVKWNFRKEWISQLFSSTLGSVSEPTPSLNDNLYQKTTDFFYNTGQTPPKDYSEIELDSLKESYDSYESIIMEFRNELNNHEYISGISHSELDVSGKKTFSPSTIIIGNQKIKITGTCDHFFIPLSKDSLSNVVNILNSPGKQKVNQGLRNFLFISISLLNSDFQELINNRPIEVRQIFLKDPKFSKKSIYTFPAIDEQLIQKIKAYINVILGDMVKSSGEYLPLEFIEKYWGDKMTVNLLNDWKRNNEMGSPIYKSAGKISDIITKQIPVDLELIIRKRFSPFFQGHY